MRQNYPNAQPTCSTGAPGLDEVLSGGLPRDYLYLLQGRPGTGKTTLALQFLLEGARLGEPGLYITFSETKAELVAVARSHGWDLSALDILELSVFATQTSEEAHNTLFHPSEIELNRVIGVLLDRIRASNPKRIVFDSISELRLLAESSLRYRRQILAFKEFFRGKGATVLFLDDLTVQEGDPHIQSIVHGVLLLEKFRAAYGVERRQLHIVKLRGVDFRGGTHDYLIKKGGIVVFPRLVAMEHEQNFTSDLLTFGVKELDDLVGGGLNAGTSNLIIGPAGTGKSTIAMRFAISAAERGKKVALFSFEERVGNLIARAESLGMGLKKHIDAGSIIVRKVYPAELTPGQFTDHVRYANSEDTDVIVIDSLNGYLHAMPEQQFLILQLHELLSYLGNRGVTTLLILSQSGIMGAMQTPLDLTYLADTVILTRYFEAFGSIKKAISVIKKRTGAHEETLREYRIAQGGIQVGKVLRDFKGVFSGSPHFLGTRDEILKSDDIEQK